MLTSIFLKAQEATNNGSDPTATQKWGSLASILLVISFFVAPGIYLVGNLRDAFGALNYDVADFLYGPVWAASLITSVFALRERLGGRAPRRMTLALLAAALAAGAMLSVAFIRAANRHYHILHPELNLEHSTTVLVVWTTLVAGMSAVGWHCLGWTLTLIGSAGWTTRGLPRLLSGIYLAGGLASLFVYLNPELEQVAVLLGLVWGTWQGILLWNTAPGEAHSSDQI